LTWEILTTVVAVVMLRRGLRRVPLFALVAVFGTVGLYDLVKVAVDRPRPVVPTPLLHPFGASFPSGHAMMSATAMTLVAMAGWHVPRSTAARLAGLTLAVAVAAMVAASRLVLGAHYLSDVLGGWLLAGAWVSVLIAGFGIRAGRANRQVPPLNPRARPAAAPDPGPRPTG
jgi:undecaprenyl-diphosphatase